MVDRAVGSLDGGGNGGCVALVEVEGAGSGSEVDRGDHDASRPLIGSKAANVEGARRVALVAERDRRGDHRTTLRHREGSRSCVANNQAAGVAPEGAVAGNEYGVVGARKVRARGADLGAVPLRDETATAGDNGTVARGTVTKNQLDERDHRRVTATHKEGVGGTRGAVGLGSHEEISRGDRAPAKNRQPVPCVQIVTDDEIATEVQGAIGSHGDPVAVGPRAVADIERSSPDRTTVGQHQRGIGSRIAHIHEAAGE